MKTISKIISVVALMIFSLSANAQLEKKPKNTVPVKRTETTTDKPLPKRSENHFQKKIYQPLPPKKVKRTSVKEIPVKQ